MNTIQHLEQNIAGLDVQGINRRILVIQLLSHVIKDSVEEIEQKLREKGQFRLAAKKDIHAIEFHCRQVRKDLFKILDEKQADDFISDMDNLKAEIYKWAEIENN